MADTKPFMEENDVLKQFMELLNQQNMREQSQDFMELFKYAAGMQLQLAVLPYGNFIIRTVGKYGEFRLCVRT